jgi:hypothetical protein
VVGFSWIITVPVRLPEESPVEWDMTFAVSDFTRSDSADARARARLAAFDSVVATSELLPVAFLPELDEHPAVTVTTAAPAAMMTAAVLSQDELR